MKNRIKHEEGEQMSDEQFNLKKNSAFKPLADLISGVMHGEYTLKEGTIVNKDWSDKENLAHYEFDAIVKIPHKEVRD